MQIDTWKDIRKKNITKWQELFTLLELDPSLQAILDAHTHFPLNLPRRLAEKIEKKNIKDPILLQFLPLHEEKNSLPGFICDPVGDKQAQGEAKLLQKYQGRALLLTTSACAMHCRYCFRKHFPYETQFKGFSPELEAIEKDSSLSEILLSGGDPLSLNDETLSSLISSLSSIPHIKRLRFHTRFPIGIPERISDSFLDLLKKTRLQVFFVIHCNHPRELDCNVLAALKQIQKIGIPVLNQTVLLRNINDNVETLSLLCSTLVDNGIIPYYLHQLDRVTGSHHFEVTEEKGIELMETLARILPGYAMPRYVREVAGLPYKQEICTQNDSKTRI